MEKTPKEGSNGVLEGVEYTVPDSDLTAFLSATSAKGKEAYTDDGGDRFQFGGARGKGGGVCGGSVGRWLVIHVARLQRRAGYEVSGFYRSPPFILYSTTCWRRQHLFYANS